MLKKKASIKKEAETNWHHQELEQMEEYDRKERDKMEQDYRQKQTNQKVIKKQLHEFKVNYIK